MTNKLEKLNAQMKIRHHLERENGIYKQICDKIDEIIDAVNILSYSHRAKAISGDAGGKRYNVYLHGNFQTAFESEDDALEFIRYETANYINLKRKQLEEELAQDIKVFGDKMASAYTVLL